MRLAPAHRPARTGLVRTVAELVGVAAIALLAACSGSDDAVGDAPVTEISALPTAAEPPATTAAATIPATTAAPTTVTVTELMPDPEELVREAVDASIEAFSACLLALPSCEVAGLETTRRGDLLAVNVQRITEWNAAGYAVRDRDNFRYVIEQVELNADATQATVLVCIADGSKLVIPGAGPGGVDVVVDDAYVSGRENWDVRLDTDGVWRPYAAPPAGPTEARDVCPAG